MASFDVEALLDAAAKGQAGSINLDGTKDEVKDESRSHGLHDIRDGRDRGRRRSRSNSRRRRDPRSLSPRSDGRASRSGDDAHSYRSDRRSSRSRDRDRDRDWNNNRGGGRRRNRRGRGDNFYPPRNGRSRSRSANRHYSPRGRDDRRRRDDYDDRRRERSLSIERLMPLTEEERDRRTVFVQQLAARLHTRQLKDFFEKAGPVAEAQIVRDRVSNRSKGVGYVEFKSEESVSSALELTGQRLVGIPVIVQLTEAEKNRQVRPAATSPPAPVIPNTTSQPFHRLYVGNIHFNINEADLRNVFDPFGKLEFVQLQRDENGRSRGYGFVQYCKSEDAREALDHMNGFELAGRPIRVGLGNDKYAGESSGRYGGGGRGRRNSNDGAGKHRNDNFDRASGRDAKSGRSGALDDMDVNVQFNNYNRDRLMRKLARDEDEDGDGTASVGTPASAEEQQTAAMPRPRVEARAALPVNVNTASRCVVLHNMFDPAEEEGDDWIKELEDDVREEAAKTYGEVVHVALDPNSKGDIYLKFEKVQGGENAIKGLNGRYFGGRMITAAPVVDAVYSSLFSRTRAI